jgi:DNA-binding NarL/FixJ family response regulator
VPKRILIVDDNDVVRKIVRGILEEEDGWEVCGEAANGREAIEKARQLTPDVIVLDLAMPVMDGLQAARELTQILPAVPLLMFTNFESTCLKQEALSAGISALVSKSESIRVLINRLRTLLWRVA